MIRSNDIDSMFNEVFNDFFGSGHRGIDRAKDRIDKRPDEPVKDIWQDKEKVYVTVALPGTKENDIQLSITDELVEVFAPKPFAENDNIGNNGYFARMQLPAKVNKRPEKKTFSNGILELVLRKSVSGRDDSDYIG